MNKNNASGHRKRLKQKYKNVGLGALFDYEILELILTYAIPRRDVKPLAKALISHFGSLSGVLSAPCEQICRIDGVGENAAMLIQLIRDASASTLGGKLKNKEVFAFFNNDTRRFDIKEGSVIDFCRLRFMGLTKERFEVICLTAKGELIDVVSISEGIVNGVAVFPRMVLETALAKHASAIILVHNHPSGEPAPSDDDYELTKNVSKASKIMGISLIGHLIFGHDSMYSVSEDKYYSFR